MGGVTSKCKIRREFTFGNQDLGSMESVGVHKK
jgi:hypothetical protein